MNAATLQAELHNVKHELLRHEAQSTRDANWHAERRRLQAELARLSRAKRDLLEQGKAA